MRISDVRTHVLLDPGYDVGATSSAQDTVVVEIETDEGLVGIGETDLNAWIARACIEAPGTHTMDRGLREMLLGRDPLDPEAIWQELYVGTAMTGRRGALINALGAIDIALWDSPARPPARRAGACSASRPATTSRHTRRCSPRSTRSTPTWPRWSPGRRRHATSDSPPPSSRRRSTGPTPTRGCTGPTSGSSRSCAPCARRRGREMTLMVDVQYAFDDVERALRAAEAIAAYDIFFLETPLWVDDLDGYAELTRRSPVRIAQGEWLTTRFEFAALIEGGCVNVAQPDIGRVGGLTEARRVVQMAAERDLLVVPHAWKTGISVAVAAQLATVTPHMPFFEFLPSELCESRLRKELVDDELVYHDGRLGIPERPGIGVELNRDALEEFAEVARRATPAAR